MQMNFTLKSIFELCLKNLVPSHLEHCATQSIFIRNVPGIRNLGILSILEEQNVCLFTIADGLRGHTA